MKKALIILTIFILFVFNYWAITQRDKEIKACGTDAQCIHRVLVAWS